jgi:hypothetical protein
VRRFATVDSGSLRERRVVAQPSRSRDRLRTGDGYVPFAKPCRYGRFLRIAGIHRYEFERQERVDSGQSAREPSVRF